MKSSTLDVARIALQAGLRIQSRCRLGCAVSLSNSAPMLPLTSLWGDDHTYKAQFHTISFVKLTMALIHTIDVGQDKVKSWSTCIERYSLTQLEQLEAVELLL